MSTFKFCFPGDNGNMVCQHLNGSWIVFPATVEKRGLVVEEKEESTTSLEEDDALSL